MRSRVRSVLALAVLASEAALRVQGGVLDAMRAVIGPPPVRHANWALVAFIIPPILARTVARRDDQMRVVAEPALQSQVRLVRAKVVDLFPKVPSPRRGLPASFSSCG